MANELELKYGCNPNQKPSRVFMKQGELPIEVLSGRPGYINLLDALNSWQLVRELSLATGLPAAASFKHVSPAGAAVGLPLSDVLKRIYFVEGMELSPMAAAYARARGADRMSSYGDWAALSGICDDQTAALISKEVSDGIIAQGYTDRALEILKKKKKGSYIIIKMDPSYKPGDMEYKDVFGITFGQRRNDQIIDERLFSSIVTRAGRLPDSAKRDLIISLITLKYTQSNSVCYAKDGQAIGIGAGQQSRIHCTRLAGDKADNWYLRQHRRVLGLPLKKGLARYEKDNAIDRFLSEDREVILDGWEQYFSEKPEPLSGEEKRAWLDTQEGVALGSDAFFPFGDNIDRASRSGVRYVAQPGGGVRDDNVIEKCDKYGITMVFTGVRLFHH